jgi:hypothetical protein
MATAKPKTTITTTEFVEHHEESSLTPMPDNGRPYIRESSDFDQLVYSKRKDAQREIDGLDMEIARLQVEIEARLTRKQDLQTIVIKADTILNMRDVSPTSSPQITDRGNA